MCPYVEYTTFYPQSRSGTPTWAVVTIERLKTVDMDCDVTSDQITVPFKPLRYNSELTQTAPSDLGYQVIPGRNRGSKFALFETLDPDFVRIRGPGAISLDRLVHSGVRHHGVKFQRDPTRGPRENNKVRSRRDLSIAAFLGFGPCAGANIAIAALPLGWQG